MCVLIVDDEPNIRRTLRVALEAMGHAVEEADSPPSALRHVERHPFDAALLDLRLGDESGLDLIAPLLTQLPRLAIVVITAHASVDTASTRCAEGVRLSAQAVHSRPGPRRS